MFAGLQSIWKIENLRQRIIFILALVLVYKFLSVIPVPGVNTEALAGIMDEQKGLAFFSALMGGGLQNFSIILMGLSPYINAVIIMQLMGVIIPKLEALQKEGEMGQKKITRMTRWLTLPLAFAQSYGMIYLLNTLAGGQIININDMSVVFMAMVIITTGTLFLMWLGEVMTEYGIGNGISIIITAGVLSGTPGVIMGYMGKEAYELFTILLVATIGVIYVIIKFTEGYRKIPVIYTRTGREEKSFFPIKVNQAGMIPIIFAISIITFPSLLGQILSKSTGETSAAIGNFLVTYFSMNNPSWYYIGVYFLLILGFAYFYISITFNTDQVAENIQKRGGFIPGIKPGSETSDYLASVSSRLNLFGGGFLALIAVFPYIAGKLMNQSIDFIISGAGLIIIVSVILDIIRKVETEKKMFDYSKF